MRVMSEVMWTGMWPCVFCPVAQCTGVVCEGLGRECDGGLD